MYDLEAAHLRELLVDLQRARVALTMLSVKSEESEKSIHRDLSESIRRWLDKMEDRSAILFPPLEQVASNVVHLNPKRARKSRTG